jgi:hypothetical protein
MSLKSCLGLVPVVAAFTLGCSAGDSSPSLLVGSEGTGGSPAGGGTGFGGDQAIVLGDAGPSRALSTHIESPPGVTVEFVTLSCSHECADVVAVAKGGFMPYTFTWEDGSTDPARRVCPAATTSYRVSVTDTGSTSKEFPRAPQTVTAPLTANVVSCPVDGGAVHRDAGFPGARDGGHGSLCGAGFKPGVYEGTFKQALGPLSGTDVISLMKSPGTATQETISGRLDNVLAGTGAAASTTWGEGSSFYCSTQRLFLTGTEAGIVPLAYTYEATYDPANDTLLGTWAAAAPPSPGVFPTSALDSGTWEAHWVRP